ncbi:hypothetical protein AKUA2003_13940 [Apilactobacillus kunkeei]|nr:hypothetical protein AKUA1001_13970 [Apilactobacillus kunkeei]CAI2664470.1 hypothetical protein AKUA2003_13940 [Apilactobacillus kunkeei]CAI2803486.1 hypothetical protein AKUA2002_13960 [Apilactobacillus kunkeei]
MYDSKKIKRLLFSAALGSTMALSLNGIQSHADTTQSFKPYTPVAYDISEFQGSLNDQEVMNLKNEVKFVVLRIQDGQYHDRQVNNNISLMEKYGIPYGVYSYSRYTNSNQAREEAKRLHSLAPNARFYANDFEISFTNTSDQDAVSWAHEMKHLTKQPVILYSSQSILDQFQQSTLNAYSAVWLANYTNYTPNPSYNYDLWQYTDKYQSKALGQTLDADTIPVGGRKLAFWTTEKTANNRKRTVAKTGTARHIKKHATTNVLHKAAKKQVIAKTSYKKAKKLQYKPLVNKVSHNTKKLVKRVYHVKKHAAKKIVKANNIYKYASATKRVKHNKTYKKHVKKHAKKRSKYTYKLNNVTKTRLAKHHVKKHKKHTKKYSYKLSKQVTRKLAHKHAKHKKHAKKYSYRVKNNLKHKKLHHSYKTKKHNKAKKHYKYSVKKIHHKHAKKYSYRVA